MSKKRKQKQVEVSAEPIGPEPIVVIDPTTGEPVLPISQGWPAPRKPKASGIIDPTTGEPVRPISQGWPSKTAKEALAELNDQSFSGTCPTCGQRYHPPEGS